MARRAEAGGDVYSHAVKGYASWCFGVLFFKDTTEHLIVVLDAKLDETGSPVVDLYELFFITRTCTYIVRRRLRLFHSAQINSATALNAGAASCFRDKQVAWSGRGILFRANWIACIETIKKRKMPFFFLGTCIYFCFNLFLVVDSPIGQVKLS